MAPIHVPKQRWKFSPSWRRPFGLHRARLVKVKSWLPHWDGRYVCGPGLLVQQRGGGRETVWPVICWAFWRAFLFQPTEQGD